MKANTIAGCFDFFNIFFTTCVYTLLYISGSSHKKMPQMGKLLERICGPTFDILTKPEKAFINEISTVTMLDTAMNLF